MSTPRATNLLNLLASVPSEMLVEGTVIRVHKLDGTAFDITLGERVPSAQGETFEFVVPGDVSPGDTPDG